MQQDVGAVLEHFEVAFSARNEIGALRLRARVWGLKNERINRQFNLRDDGVPALTKK